MRLKPVTMSITSKTVVLLALLCNGDCAKILGIFHFPSPSHHILGSHLLKELARRGHEVTMISPYPLKQPMPNYTDIYLPEMVDFKENNEHMQKLIAGERKSFTDMFKMLDLMSTVMGLVFNNSDVQTLLNSKDAHFDLVLTVSFGDALLSFGHHFNAPVITFSTQGSGFMNNYLTANSAPFAYVPNMLLNVGDRMTFFERVQNTLVGVVCNILSYGVLPKYENALLEKYMPDSPSVEELRKTVALVLLNSHYSVETPRPSVPNMIQVGGIHVEESKELSGELKEFLDSATDGVIFFSLGSNVKSVDLNTEKLDVIVKVFSKLPQKVLWKWEDDVLPGQPKNVKLGKWLPQRDILAHPNVIAFITHGGLLSTSEAVYHGVPIIGIPFFGDQHSNVKISVLSGYCIQLQLTDLTEETLSHAIDEILHNSKYRENVRQRSSLMRDQPLKPLDSAVFWVEHVLRHNGASHIRVAAMDLRWYQILLLDVIAFIGGSLLIILLALYLIIKSIIKLGLKIFGRSKHASKQRKLKNN